MPSKKESAHAAKLVDNLISNELLELVDGATTADIIQAVAVALVAWTDNYERSTDLAELLADLPDVAEVFATDEQLDDAIATWRRAVRAPKPAVTDKRDLALEARLPTEPELAAVYADWLIERGNPLGELFACATNDAARKRVLANHGDVLWGNVADYKSLFDITWSTTGIAEIVVERSTAIELEWGRVIGALLDRPLATFCRALRIGPLPPYTPFEEILGHIAARPRRALQHIEVHAGDSSYAIVGLPDLATGFPNLQKLVLSGRRVDGPLAHPSVERLHLGLESLVVMGDSLARIEMPALRRLALRSREPLSGERAVAPILAAPWLAQLAELDLAGLSLDDVARDHFARHRARFSHVRIVFDG